MGPVARAQQIFGADRAQWFAIAGLVAALNAMATSILALFGARGLAGAFHEAGALNPAVLFGLFAVAAIAFETDVRSGRRTIDRRDAFILGLALLLAGLPAPAAGAMGLTIAGIWLWARGASNGPERRIAVVLIALSTRLLWGRFVLLAFGDRLLTADAVFVGWLSGTGSAFNTVTVEDGPDVLIGYACSSMHNITQVLVLWAAFTQLLRIPLGKASLAIAGVAIAANVLVNGVRLATIVVDPQRYDYWHSGGGGTLFAWAAMLAAGLIVGIGCHALTRARA